MQSSNNRTKLQCLQNQGSSSTHHQQALCVVAGADLLTLFRGSGSLALRLDSYAPATTYD